MFYVYYLNYFCKVGTIIIPILQMRELRLKEFGKLFRVRTVNEWLRAHALNRIAMWPLGSSWQSPGKALNLENSWWWEDGRGKTVLCVLSFWWESVVTEARMTSPWDLLEKKMISWSSSGQICRLMPHLRYIFMEMPWFFMPLLKNIFNIELRGDLMR